MKFTIGATIPVAQYGNLQPQIEVEAETYEEAYATAMPRIEAIWNKYVDGKQIGNARTKLTAFVGGSIYYDDLTHTYTNEQGEVYLSGSTYAKQFEKPFDKIAISNAIAKKFKADPQAIVDMWELKGEVSRGFGTALHKALELYGRYDGLAKAIDKDTALHDHPVIKKAVEGFYASHTGKAEYELMIVDHETKRAGQIDYLRITGDKKCIIGDFKTNAVMSPANLENYAHQLSFYAEIMEAGGWAVEGLELYHWNGNWQDIKLERKEVK